MNEILSVWMNGKAQGFDLGDKPNNIEIMIIQ